MTAPTSSLAPSGLRSARFARWAWLLPLALAAGLLLPGIAGFPFADSQSAFSDLAISHYPNALYLRSAVLAGRFPLWNPQILSGAPFAANPLSGLWYPPGWPALLLPLPLGFNLVILLHLAWGGWGLYCLLREEGLGEAAALLGAAAFMLLPKLYAHYGAGHLTLLYAVPWTPWLLLAARRRGWWEAIILALIFLADPRWSVYAGLLWLGYSLSLNGRAGLGATAVRLFGRTLLAGLLAAPLALPLLEYARQSTRSAMDAQDTLAFSLPPARLLGLLYPDFGGFHEYMLYTGQALLALAVVALLGLAAQRWTRFWGGTALLALLWSLGSALPPVGWLAGLPGLDLLRVPSRALFLLGLALVCLAARAAQALASQSLDPKRLRGLRLALAGLCALSLALTLGVTLISGSQPGSKLPLHFAWGSGFLLAAVVWIFLRLNGRVSSRGWLAGLALIAVLDLGGMDRSLFVSRPAAQVLAQGADAAAYLAGQPGHFRVYSPSYSLPQQTAAAYGLELVDGVDPMQLQSYVNYMEDATGIPMLGYSVTLPPLGAESSPQPEGEAQSFSFQSNAAYTPNAALLAALDVAYVVSAFDIAAPDLILEKRLGETRIYRNTIRPGRVWFPGGTGSPMPTNGEIVSWTPERIEIRAAGTGMLILAEVAYPGWQVRVDGEKRPLTVSYDLLRGVYLPSGEHTVVFEFRPFSVYAGLGLCALALLYIGIQAVLSRRRAQ